MEKAKNSLIRTYGRRHGKKLSARQQYLINNILPNLEPGKNDAMDAILEIGFGSGEHLLELAEQNPDKIIIGAEPFINGIASLLSKITKNDTIRFANNDKITELQNYEIIDEYKNIRIWPDDVRKFLPLITCRFSLIYILHPDPWPKARHEKRRLLSAEFLKTLASFISKDGSIIIGTDHTDYHNWILEQTGRANLQIKSCDIAAIKTKYQEKNIFGSDRTMYMILGK